MLPIVPTDHTLRRDDPAVVLHDGYRFPAGTAVRVMSHGPDEDGDLLVKSADGRVGYVADNSLAIHAPLAPRVSEDDSPYAVDTVHAVRVDNPFDTPLDAGDRVRIRSVIPRNGDGPDVLMVTRDGYDGPTYAINRLALKAAPAEPAPDPEPTPDPDDPFVPGTRVRVTNFCNGAEGVWNGREGVVNTGKRPLGRYVPVSFPEHGDLPADDDALMLPTELEQVPFRVGDRVELTHVPGVPRATGEHATVRYVEPDGRYAVTTAVSPSRTRPANFLGCSVRGIPGGAV